MSSSKHTALHGPLRIVQNNLADFRYAEVRIQLWPARQRVPGGFGRAYGKRPIANDPNVRILGPAKNGFAFL